MILCYKYGELTHLTDAHTSVTCWIIKKLTMCIGSAATRQYTQQHKFLNCVRCYKYMGRFCTICFIPKLNRAVLIDKEKALL
jgi:hypothetical protein